MGNIKDLQYRALQIANHYDEYNRQVGRKGWDMRDHIEDLVGSVGDLAKANMAVIERCGAAEKVEHELNDIMWSLLLLYRFYRLKPGASFLNSMDRVEERIVKMKSAGASL